MTLEQCRQDANIAMLTHAATHSYYPVPTTETKLDDGTYVVTWTPPGGEEQRYAFAPDQ